MITLIETIQNAILTDTSRIDKDSCFLKTEYMNSSEITKQIIDNCFIHLCGWSMKTLIQRNIEQNMDDNETFPNENNGISSMAGDTYEPS